MKRKWLGTKLALASCLFAGQAVALAPSAGAGGYYCEGGDYAQTVSAYDSPDYQQMHDTRTHDYVDVKVTINGTYMKLEGEDEYLSDADWCILTYQGPEYGSGLSGYSDTYNHYGYRELIKEVTVYNVTTYDHYYEDDGHDDGKKGNGHPGKKADHGKKGGHDKKADDYGKKAEEYGAKAHEYGKKANEYGTKAHEYGQKAYEYGKQADYYNKKAHAHGGYNHHYGKKAEEYGNKARTYGDQSKEYGKKANEYGEQSREYGRMADEYGKKANQHGH